MKGTDFILENAPDWFMNCIIHLYDYFDKSYPTGKQYQMWFFELKSYKREQIEEAVFDCRKTLEFVPRNLPLTVKANIAKLFGNPEKIWINYGKCLGCKSSGFYTLLQKDKESGIWGQSILFCSDCHNWKNIAGEDIYK